jgi:NAD(P)-dependent dehydrogenase (short-subunit alcohol dehydrogenase family)
MTGAPLAGRSALVTGASRGIGQAIAEALAAAGAEVVLASRSRGPLDQVAEAIAARGGKASVRLVDLCDRDDVRSLAVDAGHVDIVVNNAGNAEVFAPLVQIEDSHWERTFAVDFWAPMTLTRDIGARMCERGRGSIINISSNVAQYPPPLAAAYVSAKAALEAMTRVAAMEFATAGVRCNAIAPGIIATELTEMMKQTAAWAFYRNAIPAGREGELAEVANFAVWLASDQASYITGQIINVDGGASAGNHGLLSAAAGQG